jgi:uncharacterized protein
MRSLLDVNVLIALLDADHVHHDRAWSWFRAETPDGWASCPITQNGCLRIMSHPNYPNALPTSAVAARLGEATRHPRHEFWADDVSLLDARVADHTRLLRPRQVTDLYLVALAVHHEGRLATFDGTIALSALAGSPERHIRVISPGKS